MTGWRGPVLITGTDTGVGKTIVTAALAAAAGRAGLKVAVLKPAQSGDDDDDAATVARLAAPTTTVTLARYAEPLAPLAAARIAGEPPLGLEPVVAAVHELAQKHDLVLVEGAGGLLVPMGTQGWTVRDLALRCGMSSLVVARAGLGTLSHTALTLEALACRPAVVVLGSWPSALELVHRSNLTDLTNAAGGARALIAGAVPEGAGDLTPHQFRLAAPSWLAPVLHGTFNLESFRKSTQCLSQFSGIAAP
ncbi:MAG: dethiobiotin synthase [Mycobacteriales bacterium]